MPDKLGREGMNDWKIFVLGVTGVTLNIAYDRLQNLLNNHIGLRKIVGHTSGNDLQQYGFTTIKDNVRLLTPEIIDEINSLVVVHAQKVIHPYSKKNTKLSC